MSYSIPTKNVNKNKTNTHRKILQNNYREQPNTPKNDKELIPLKTSTHIIQKIQTHNPKHDNKNNNKNLRTSTQTYKNNNNVQITFNKQYPTKLTYKTTKTRKTIPTYSQKTKLIHTHINPNNKTKKKTSHKTNPQLKTPKTNLKRARPTGLAQKK